MISSCVSRVVSCTERASDSLGTSGPGPPCSPSLASTAACLEAARWRQLACSWRRYLDAARFHRHYGLTHGAPVRRGRAVKHSELPTTWLRRGATNSASSAEPVEPNGKAAPQCAAGRHDRRLGHRSRAHGVHPRPPRRHKTKEVHGKISTRLRLARDRGAPSAARAADRWEAGPAANGTWFKPLLLTEPFRLWCRGARSRETGCWSNTTADTSP